MDVQTPPNSITSAKRTTSSALGWTLLFFALVWVAFFTLERWLPYLKNGSDVVFNAKLQWEQKGQVFPADPRVTRVLIFGNSKILAGFLPALFDQESSQNHLNVSSFNSGFPGSDLFFPPLQALCARGQAPSVLLLTLPWNPDPPRRGIFHFIPDDHAVIDHLFPFRNFLRDLTAFLLAAPSHGGLVRYYRESQDNERQVIAERGYHLITEQSHFPGGRLPDDFHLGSDQPMHEAPPHCACPKHANGSTESAHQAISHRLLLRSLLFARWGSSSGGGVQRTIRHPASGHVLQAAWSGLLPLSQSSLCRSDPPQ